MPPRDAVSVERKKRVSMTWEKREHAVPTKRRGLPSMHAAGFTVIVGLREVDNFPAA